MHHNNCTSYYLLVLEMFCCDSKEAVEAASAAVEAARPVAKPNLVLGLCGWNVIGWLIVAWPSRRATVD